MTDDDEPWRDVLQNFETFLEHADWSQKSRWAEDMRDVEDTDREERAHSAKVSLAYSWKADAIGEFDRVNPKDEHQE